MRWGSAWLTFGSQSFRDRKVSMAANSYSGGAQRVHHLRSLSDVSPAPLTGLHTTTRRDEVDDSVPNGRAAAGISDAIVRILRVHAERAPVEATTALSSDLAVVTLRDGRMPAERLATEVRTVLHAGLRPEANAAVEAITGRSVIAYLTDEHDEPDVAIVAFVFASPQWHGHVAERGSRPVA